LSARRREHLNVAAEALTGDRRRSAGALGLFALSPVPSAQLFVAAGSARSPATSANRRVLRRAPDLLTTYVSGAAPAQDSLSDVLGNAFASPVAIALQIAVLLALIALLRINWISRLASHRPDRRRPGDVLSSAGSSPSSDLARSPTSARSRMTQIRFATSPHPLAREGDNSY
jgi:hypothetical protein